MRKIALVLFVAVLATAGPSGALPAPSPDDLPAIPGLPAAAGGAIGTDNVEFVATFPDIAAMGAKILGDTMYLTTPAGLRIYDVSLGLPVLIGALSLPHFENEAVDTNGEILLIAADHFVLGGIVDLVYVIDVRIPQAPLLLTVLEVDGAHTATCIKDCRFAWTAGGDVLDLRDPANATRLGRAPVGSHNANVDEAGYAWLGGSRVFDTNAYGASNALNPPRIASGGFGWHNTIRPDATRTTPTALADGDVDPGELVLGTDEDWAAAMNGLCEYDGPFRTSWMHTVNGTLRVDQIDSFAIGQGTLPDAKPVGLVSCSSHWLDYHEGVVADAWYEQGVRFFDVSDQGRIRQIGYFMPAVTEAWMADYHVVPDGPTAGTYVYVYDGARGLDVLRWVGGSNDPTVRAPLNAAPAGVVARPDARWGWVCRSFEPAA